jgi:hypothetical protein
MLHAATGLVDSPELMSVGPRAMSMGRGYTAVDNDPNAVFFNPAGLAHFLHWQGMSMYSNLLSEVNVLTLAVVFPSQWGVFGVGYVNRYVDGISLLSSTDVLPGTTRPDPAQVRNSSYSDSLLILAKPFPVGSFKGFGELNSGLSLKLFNSGASAVTDASSSGYGLDLGMHFLPYAWPNLKLGFSQTNLLSSIANKTGSKDEFLSLSKFGASYYFPSRGITLTGDLDLSPVRSRPLLYHLGTEWQVNPLFYLRGGLDQLYLQQATSTALTMGLGFKWENISFDYAYHPFYSEAENTTHYFSISYINRPKPELEISVYPLEIKPGRILTVETRVIHTLPLKTIEALFPDNTTQKLEYDNNTGKWYALWSVPAEGMQLGDYQVTVRAEDIQKTVNTARSTTMNLTFDQPILEKVSLVDRSITYERSVIISGNVKYALGLLINGKAVSFNTETGWFTEIKPLQLGKNLIKIEAIGSKGEITSQEARILRMADLSDVPIDYYSRQEILTMTTLKLLGIYSNGTFRPDQAVSRIEMAVLLNKLKNWTIRPEAATVANFDDVRPSFWGFPYVENAIAAKYLTGYDDGKFHPELAVTRLQTISILAKLEDLNLTGNVNALPFTDIPKGHWGAPYLQAVLDNGLLSGRAGSQFYPNEALNRSVLANWLGRTTIFKQYMKDLYDWGIGYGQEDLSISLAPVISTQNTSAVLLNIASPQDKSVVFEPKLKIHGNVLNSDRLYINNAPVPINNNMFEYTQSLQYGKNSILFLAIDQEGRKAELSVRALCLPAYQDLDSDVHKYMLGYLGVILNYNKDKIYSDNDITDEEALALLQRLSDKFDYPVDKVPLTRAKAALMCAALAESKLSPSEREAMKAVGLSGQQIFTDIKEDDHALSSAIELLYKLKVFKRVRYFNPQVNMNRLEWFKLMTKLPVVRSRIRQLVDWKRDYTLLSATQANEGREREIPGDDFMERALRLFPEIK